MLKFNNYPPTEPSDVELAESATVAIERTKRLTNHPMEDVRIRANATLYGFGQAIGHTIFATVPREQYSEYTQPFSEIHHSMRHGIEVAYAEVVELNDGVAHV